MQKRKEEDEEKKTLDTLIYPVVLIGTKLPLVSVVEALTLGYCFLLIQTLSGHPLTCHKGLATKAHTKFPSHLDAIFAKEFLH